MTTLKLHPPGAHFSQEWGLADRYSGSVGNWTEYRYSDVVDLIFQIAGNPNLDKFGELSNRAREAFVDTKDDLLSLIHANLRVEQDNFLQNLVEKIEKLKVFSEVDYIKAARPTGQFMSRDIIALEKGPQTPPHYGVKAKVLALECPFKRCSELSKIAIRLANHIRNVEKKIVTEERIGTNIFIGHGRSAAWRELKDFVSERLKLPWDEFNRVPVAGVTNIARLSQMLDQAAFAFLIMTAEDEQADNKLHARMNVIHEVGLFQGRLGFDKAIILLEEGCEEFSNIQGLGQIRFPRGQIDAIFENVRRVLEREELVE